MNNVKARKTTRGSSAYQLTDCRPRAWVLGAPATPQICGIQST